MALPELAFIFVLVAFIVAAPLVAKEANEGRVDKSRSSFTFTIVSDLPEEKLG